MLDAEGVPATKEGKVLHLINIIVNETLSTGKVSHIFTSPVFSRYFQSAATHTVATASNLKLIVPYVNDQGGGMCHGIKEVKSGGSNNKQETEQISHTFNVANAWESLSHADCNAIRKFQEYNNLGRGSKLSGGDG